MSVIALPVMYVVFIIYVAVQHVSVHVRRGRLLNVDGALQSHNSFRGAFVMQICERWCIG